MSIKTSICVTVDYDIVAELRARGDKISPVINNLLRSHLNLISDRDIEEHERLKNVEEAKIKIAEKLGQIKELRQQKERLEREEEIKRRNEELQWKIIKE